MAEERNEWSMYRDLFAQIASLQERTARFRRVVLHLHSPDSHDWGRDKCDRAKNDRVTLMSSGGTGAFIGALRPCLDLVAVTDHMKCTYACNLSHDCLLYTSDAADE